MKIYQLVYTKVPKEESPWGKADFHTVFYPIDLIRKEELFEIERRIYFPGVTFDEKEVVFFQKICGEYFLIILHIKNLPEDKDAFGRGGIFICHGFLFPEELWRKFSSFLVLFELLKNFLFRSRDKVFSSNLINRKTGNILPLEISLESVKEISNRLPRLTSDFELKMVILFNRIASQGGGVQTVLLKGKPKEITYFMDKMLAYVPDDIKVNLGFDPAFDGGSLSFHPIKIVGYSESMPTGGNPIKIDLEKFTVDGSEEFSDLFIPTSPYERWLYHCREASFKEQIEKAYRLSLFLDRGLPSEDYLDNKKCFCSVNKDLIIDRFRRRVENLVGVEIIEGLKALPVDIILDLLVEDIPLGKLANYIEDVVINRSLPLSSSRSFISSSIVQSGSFRLRLIERLWREGVVERGDFYSLSKKEKVEFARYLVLNGFLSRDWMRELIDEEIFDTLFSSRDTRVVIKSFLRRVIEKDVETREIADILFREIVDRGKVFVFLKGVLNFMKLFEESLKNKKWEEEDLKRLSKWLKKRKGEERERLIKLISEIQGYRVELKSVVERDINKRMLSPWSYKAIAMKFSEMGRQIVDRITDGVSSFLKLKNLKKKKKRREQL